MARRHVIQYFLEVEKNYVEMQDTLNELQQLAQEGKVEESNFLTIQKNVQEIKTNYERIAYIIFLLNKPNREVKAKKESQRNKLWYDKLQQSSKEAILKESEDALKNIKLMLKEIKNDN